MNLQRLLVAAAILLSSNTVVSAQFSLRSLIDGLKSTVPPNEQKTEDPQGLNQTPTLDAPSLQSDPELGPPAVRQRVDLDSLPQLPPSLSPDAKAPLKGPQKPDTLINKPQTELTPQTNDPSSNLAFAEGLDHPYGELTASPLDDNRCSGCAMPRGCASPECTHRHSTAKLSCHPGATKPIVCLDRPNLPPPVSNRDLYRTPLHYNNLWGDYLDEQVKARRKAYGALLAPPKSIYATQSTGPGANCREPN